MNVIKFPGGEGAKTKGQALAPQQKLYVNTFGITCSCGNKSTIEPQNLIFRSMDFYCPKCGTYHQITNPAFTPSTPPAPAKRR